MPYDINLADKVRAILAQLTEAVEKEMFSGICFMIDDKMCICVSRDELLCRIGENEVARVLEEHYCRPMRINGRISKDYIFVGPEGFKSPEQLALLIERCLAFNPLAKASKRKL